MPTPKKSTQAPPWLIFGVRPHTMNNRFRVLAVILMTAAAFCLMWGPSTEAGEVQKRDPWLWPFSSLSIWNMPIGSHAEFTPASLPESKYIGCDVEWHIRTRAEDPVYPVYSPSTWERRWPGDVKLGELRIPDDLIIPDAEPPHTPNACAAFLMPDGRTVRQLEPACRSKPEPRIVGWLHADDQDLYGEGIKGTHYGSGLSAIGGSIRKGELLASEPMRHALKLNVWGKHLYYGEHRPGFRWPADRCDAKARQHYLGQNPSLVMGTLLAIPPQLTPEQLAVKSEVGRKIFHALQDYGAYVSDDSGWDAYDLCVERGVPDDVHARYGYSLSGEHGVLVEEMKRMVKALMIVENNGPASLGGGGTPRRPLAPGLAEPAG